MTQARVPCAGIGLFLGEDRRGARLDALLGRIAGGWLGEDHRRWSVERTPAGAPHLHGPPRSAAAAVSVSHVGTRLVVAIARGGSLGVDAETRARLSANATARDCWLSVAERRSCEAEIKDAAGALASRWVLKEALGKAMGSGLPLDPATWSFDVGDQIELRGGSVSCAFFLVAFGNLLIGIARRPGDVGSAVER